MEPVMFMLEILTRKGRVFCVILLSVLNLDHVSENMTPLIRALVFKLKGKPAVGSLYQNTHI